MSYSLLKNVFPNFGSGDNKTYAEHNYKKMLDEPVSPSGSPSLSPSGSPSLSPVVPVPPAVPMSPLVSPPPSGSPSAPVPFESDNTRGAEIAIAKSISPLSKKGLENQIFMEKFEDTHTGYIQHIAGCQECRELLERQFKLAKGGNSTGLDDTLMEIGLYVLFGVFILSLLEK